MSAAGGPALAGRVAIVTGAGSGIGEAVAVAYARVGATVACLDVRGEAAAATAARIRADGATADAHEVDVGDGDALGAVIDGVAQHHGRLDVLASIAGISASAAVVDQRDEDLSRILAVTVVGAFAACRHAGRAMVAQGSGSIVTMSSTAIDVPTPTLAAYSAAKAAVTMLTKVLAVELGPHGVRANAVAPGYVPTPMTEDPARAHTASREAMAARTPLRRVATVEDIAAAFVYLASDDAAFVTGQTLRVNGGISTPW